MVVMSSAASHLDRITVDPTILHGQPAIRGMRISVQLVLERPAADMTFDEVLADYPYLERDDLLAALEYGAVASGGQHGVPVIP
jgi:uncharacterized protein (DUF433 family)